MRYLILASWSIFMKKAFYKSLLSSGYLWRRAQLAINKKQKYFSLLDHQLAKNVILVFGFYERTKKGIKATFLTTFVGIIVMIIFIWNVSQIPCKIFATQCFFTDHLKHKTVHKTACRTPSVNPCQLSPN